MLDPSSLRRVVFFWWPFKGGSFVTVLLCASLVSYVCFGIFYHLSFVWCLWKAVLRDCGISWVSSLMRTSTCTRSIILNGQKQQQPPKNTHLRLRIMSHSRVVYIARPAERRRIRLTERLTFENCPVNAFWVRLSIWLSIRPWSVSENGHSA